MIAVFEHGREIGRDAFHTARTDGFHTRLLNRFKHRARILLLRQQSFMRALVMAGETQSHGIGMAADNRNFARCQLARRLRQARFRALTRADQGRTVRSISDFEFLRARHGTHTPRHRSLERFLRRIGLGCWLAVRCHSVTRA